MTQRCFITLKSLPKSNSNPHMRDADARALYGTSAFSGCLNVSRQTLFTEGARETKGFSISGVQQKLSMRFDHERNTLVPTQTDGTFIIKPTPDPFPYCAELEHLGMLISRTLGIDTALCGLVEFEGGEKAYVTRRFDRIEGTDDKRTMEDLCSLAGLRRDNKYDSTYEAAGLILREATGGKAAVMLDYFNRVVAAYLMGNEDLHLKNFSVIRDPGDTSHYYPGLSPNYDCVPTRVYLMNTNGAMAMPLTNAEQAGDFSDAFSYYGYYTYQDFQHLGLAIGLNERAIGTCIKRLNAKLSAILELIEATAISDEYKTRLAEEISGRARAITAVRQ